MKKSNFTIKLFLAFGIFIATVLALMAGFVLLKKFTSKSFVLNASIANINKEIENSVKSKNLLAQNQERLAYLSTHSVSGESEIPLVIEEIENYTGELGLPLVVNSIDFDDGESEDKSLAIYISSYGDFGKLFKLIRLFENSNFIFSIDEYTLKQVYVLPPNNAGGAPTFRNVTGDEQGASANKTWLLNATLTINVKK